MGAKVFTISAGLPFAETLARGVVEKLGASGDPLALSAATIYLPTRRAVRTLGDVFAGVLGGAALLPRLVPLGDVDEDGYLPAEDREAFELPPAIGPIERLLLLASLVRRLEAAKDGEVSGFAQTFGLARALADFLDEAGTHEADLSRLESLAPDGLAAHWQDVCKFLVLLRDSWPEILASKGMLDPPARRSMQLDGLTERIRTRPPAAPLIAAGTTGSIPATARFLAAVAGLPNGFVVLPGLDRDLDEESWERVDPGHPQYGMKELIGRIGIDRRDVRDWIIESAPSRSREVLLRETLRPAPTTDAWRAIAESKPETKEAIAQGLEGLSLVEAADPGTEALAVALILREALETGDQTAALVTPDRNLARRVASELTRWNVAIDDSAGRPLAHTTTGAFLLLLADAAIEDFPPVALLALLKHPFTAGGIEPQRFRHMARLLDRACLRGPRPDPGLEGVRKAIEKKSGPDAHALLPWFDDLARRLSPLCDALAAPLSPIDRLAEAHLRAAEALAETDRDSGASRLWSGEAGAVAARLFVSLQDETGDIPPVEPAAYPSLLRILMEQQAVRPAHGRHPRLAILGPLEARLQRFDVLVLGGLNEGTWPTAAAADPWLSRPMRQVLGLPPPERAIGLSAHDFATLACSPRTILTRALKADGAPAVESRWLQRLKQLAAGLGLDERLESEPPYSAWAELLEHPDDYKPESRPEPRPPVSLRPRSLSVTEIETWLRDPYAIYAKHVLRLSPLKPLDAPIGPLERGTTIHAILERFLNEKAVETVERAQARLIAIADRVFAEAGIQASVKALWRPRFIRAARWFVESESALDDAILRSYAERRGTMTFEAPAGAFTLSGRADRIDVLRAGGAAIVDYKTGTPPSPKQVALLLAPQLPLEGAILAAGGFPEMGKLAPKELVYVQFGSGAEGGRRISISEGEELAAEVARRLAARVAAFDNPYTAYFPRVMPFRKEIAGDYDHLARVREWSISGWQEDAE